EYKHVYSSNEEKEKQRHFDNFKKSFYFMENFMNGPKESYTIGLNLFTDMHEDEMKA
ncbi:unnamed protein product, partial [Prunus brigantina]